MNGIQQMGEQAKAEYLPIVKEAEAVALAINSAETYEMAGTLYQQIKVKIKQVGEVLDPFVQAAHKTWKEAVAERGKYLEPLERAEQALKPALGAWQAEQRRIQEEEQRKAEAEAQRKAEDERIAQAEAAKAAGDADLADAMLSAPVIAAPVAPMTSAAPKIKGLSFRDNYSAQVVDLKALIKAVAAGTVPMAAILPNESFLNSQAKQLKGEFNYPGVKCLKNNIPVSR